MKPVQLWTKALRSGRYQQCKGSLCYKGEAYCCLGVAIEIAMEAGLPIEKVVLDGGAIRYVDRERGERSSGGLLSRVVEWLDIGDIGKWGCYRGRDLVSDNDEGRSFVEIAEIIEKEFSVS